MRCSRLPGFEHAGGSQEEAIFRSTSIFLSLWPHRRKAPSGEHNSAWGGAALIQLGEDDGPGVLRRGAWIGDFDAALPRKEGTSRGKKWAILVNGGGLVVGALLRAHGVRCNILAARGWATGWGLSVAGARRRGVAAAGNCSAYFVASLPKGKTSSPWQRSFTWVSNSQFSLWSCSNRSDWLMASCGDSARQLALALELDQPMYLGLDPVTAPVVSRSHFHMFRARNIQH